MSRLVSSSSLSAETARIERLAGERRGRDESPAAAGPGGFAGLLRAAGVQPTASPSGGAQVLRSALPGAQRMNPPQKAPTAAAPAQPARPQASDGESKPADARARTERPRSAAAADSTSPTDEAGADKAAPDESSAPEASPSGGATLAHWMMQAAALRPAGGEAGRVAGKGAPGGGQTAAGGADAASALNLPHWARHDGDDAGRSGVWAGGAASAGAPSAPQADAGGAAQALDAATPGAPSAGAGSLDSTLNGTLNGFASQLAALAGGAAQAAGSAGAPAAAAGEAFVQTPVGSPGFGDEVMMKVAAFSHEGLQEAQLHLNPAELGPIQVRIALDGSQARIDFGAATDSTRALLESALPALAQALQADGLQLAASSVVREMSEPAASADFSGSDSGRDDAGLAAGQGDAGGGRSGGGWGQQSEAGAARTLSGGAVPGAPTRSGRGAEGLTGWGGERRAGPAAGLSGLDLYA